MVRQAALFLHLLFSYPTKNTKGLHLSVQPLYIIQQCQPKSSIDVGISGIILNKLAARWHIVTHQHGEYIISIGVILNFHLTQQTVFRIHGGVPKLNFTHFTQTFVSLHMHTLVAIFLAIF